MVIANYLSAYAGFIITRMLGYKDILYSGSIDSILGVHVDIYNAIYFIIGMPLVYFCLTVLIESSFVLALLSNKAYKLKKLIFVAILIQIPTNAVMFTGYFLFSKYSLYTQADICHDCILFNKSEEYKVYFTNPKDKYIYSYETITGQIKKLNVQAPTERQTNSTCLGHCKYDVELDFWPAYGMSVKNDGYRILQIGLETPSVQFWPSNATLINDKYVIWGLGDQIVLLDIKKRKIQKLCTGINPSVRPAHEEIPFRYKNNVNN